METILTELLLVASFIAIFVTALIEVFKKTFDRFPMKYIPVIALFMGILIGYLAWVSFDIGVTLAYALWGGGIAGLASVGLFEGVKKIMGRQTK